jgi:hypothetical protein
MTTSEVIALVSLVISLGMLIWNVGRYFQPLRLTVTDYVMLGFVTDTIYMAVRVTCQNPSARAKTIYQIEFHALPGYQLFLLPGTLEPEKRLVTYPNPISPAIRHVYQLEDIIYPPLDIESLHSRSGYYLLGITGIKPPPLPRSGESTTKTPSIPSKGALIVALNEKGKELARTMLFVSFS